MIKAILTTCATLAIVSLVAGDGNAMIRADRLFKDPAAVQLADAAMNGDVSRLQDLLGSGADAKVVGERGMTLAQIALLARKNAPQVMKIVLDAGADPISPLADGETVPHAAVSRDHADPEVVAVILDHGVSPNWFPRSGAYSELSLLQAAVMGDNLPVVKTLLARGANLDYVDPVSGSALHHALDGLHFAIAAHLVEAGIDLNLRNKTSADITNPRVVSRTAIEEFCATEGGRRGANPLPRIAEGWRLFTEALRRRGTEMPCGL